MGFMLENLGCNSGYLSAKEIKALGYHFIETSINRHFCDRAMVEKMLGDLEDAKLMKIPYAIHLPIYLPEDWQEKYDCYDAFYLDPDPEKRKLSFDMLENNLSQLTKTYKPMYFVIHFPGIYDMETVYHEDFDLLLKETLEEVEALGQRYECMIALEYFATNSRFARYEDWIEQLKPYKHIGPLLDTGHLYFSCYKHHFDFDEVLKGLAPHCIGFHIWNVYGSGYYNDLKSYKNYRHIVPRLEQTREDGWAFTPSKVIPYLASFNKPILVEAAQYYKGLDYYREGLIQIRELLKNDELC